MISTTTLSTKNFVPKNFDQLNFGHLIFGPFIHKTLSPWKPLESLQKRGKSRINENGMESCF